MVGQGSPEAYSYITALKEAYKDEPAMITEFTKLSTDYKARRLDCASLRAKVEELLKDHPELLPGFDVSLHKANRTITPELTIDDSRSYVAAVKEAFCDDPEKYEEFLRILHYVVNNRNHEAIYVAQMEELMIDHPNLFLGFKVFLSPETTRTVLPEAKTAISRESMITIIPETKRLTYPEDTETIPPEVNRTIAPESKTTFSLEAKTITPPKPRIKFTSKFKRTTRPEAKIITPPKPKISITYKAKRPSHPEAEHHVADSNCTKRKRVESNMHNFLDKLKTRFRTLDTHKFQSFYKILKDFREGKMPEQEVYRKVCNVLYYHEDLIGEFSSFLSQDYSNLG